MVCDRLGYGYHACINEYIRRHKCRKIMEIGVNDGDNAREMIECAKVNFQAEEVEYYGFDMFRGSWFGDSGFEHVEQKLLKTGAKIKLYKGDSTETLPKTIKDLPKMNLIFIDGGHSYPTVKSDWENSKYLMNRHTAVFFHNYDFPGPRKVVDNIPQEEFSVESVNSLSVLIDDDASDLCLRNRLDWYQNQGRNGEKHYKRDENYYETIMS